MLHREVHFLDVIDATVGHHKGVIDKRMQQATVAAQECHHSDPLKPCLLRGTGAIAAVA